MSETDTRYMSKEFMLKFIEAYKSHPCLWKTKSREYNNKHLKNKAYEQLIKMWKTIVPEADRDFVFKKIQSLRGSFRKELKKVEKSKKNGIYVHTPSLWYFDLLLFTKDQESLGESISNVTDTEENDNLEDQDLDQKSDESFSEESQPLDERILRRKTIEDRNNKPTLLEQSNFRRGRKRINASTESRQFFDLCKPVLEPQSFGSNLSEFEAVGVSIAKKLQRMHPTQAILAENLINNALTRGLLDTLSDKIHLCDGSCREQFNSQNLTSSTSWPSSAASLSFGDQGIVKCDG